MVLAARRQVLFNPGPVNLDPAITENLFNVELCHRQPEFDELDASVRRRLFASLGLSPDNFNLSLLHGSGTLAVDAALASLVRGRVLVLDNGLYCERISRTLESIDGTEVLDHDAGMGRPVSRDQLETLVDRHRPDWVAMVHHETTTGLLNSLSDVADVCAHHGCRLFVDAVSSMGAHPIDPRADVMCFNSNKCLESLPGIAGVFWKANLRVHPCIPVLDVAAYADGLPSTPNVQAFLALDVALDLFAAEDRPARYRRLARQMWRSGGRHFEPFLDEADRSNVLTSFCLDGRDPDRLFELGLRHGYVIYHGQRQLRDQIFRVANMGAAIDEAVIDDLFSVLSS
jgi:2-aminoethylphosphonate-pyruvate transaminase